MLLAALTNGLKVDLAVFNGGGGMQTNWASQDKAGKGDSAAYIPETSTQPSGTKWAELLPGAPPWQRGFLCPSGFGWDDAYWRFSGGKWTEIDHQRFALSLWPTTEGEGGSWAGDYTRECARRKCLGVAAYAYAFASWLRAIHAGLTACGLSLYDVVDTLDIGNELAQYWRTTTKRKVSAEEVAYGALEVGRYLALLAGPIRMMLPAMRFRTEISSWVEPTGGGTEDDIGHRSRAEWLAEVLGEGIVAEADWWQEVQLGRVLRVRGGAVSPEVERWLEAEATMGFAWPHVPERGMALPGAGELMQQVGFHWYHCYNRDPRSRHYPEGYADAAKTRSDVGTLRTVIARATGFSLGLTVGEIGIPAIDPGTAAMNGAAEEDWDLTYSGASGVLQAALQLRVLLVLLSERVEAACIYTFNHGYPSSTRGYPDTRFPGGWGTFNSQGVRNDIAYAAGYLPSAYLQGEDCWPRPSWFTFRRLAWLLAQGSSTLARVDLVHEARGLTLIAVRLPNGISTGPDGARLDQTWHRAYVAWLDQETADDDALELAFLEEGPTAPWQQLAMVPEVSPAESGEAPDAAGYAVASTDWAWGGWDGEAIYSEEPWSPMSESREVVSRLSVTIPRCRPKLGRALVPAVFFSNATFEGVRTRG
jgi:hypothetical protein